MDNYAHPEVGGAAICKSDLDIILASLRDRSFLSCNESFIVVLVKFEPDMAEDWEFP